MKGLSDNNKCQVFVVLVTVGFATIFLWSWEENPLVSALQSAQKQFRFRASGVNFTESVISDGEDTGSNSSIRTSNKTGGSKVTQDESTDQVVAFAVRGTKVKLLDVTAISELRDEGHISRYSVKATKGVNDCLHWCLPGIPDTWNEILATQI